MPEATYGPGGMQPSIRRPGPNMPSNGPAPPSYVRSRQRSGVPFSDGGRITVRPSNNATAFASENLFGNEDRDGDRRLRQGWTGGRGLFGSFTGSRVPFARKRLQQRQQQNSFVRNRQWLPHLFGRGRGLEPVRDPGTSQPLQGDSGAKSSGENQKRPPATAKLSVKVDPPKDSPKVISKAPAAQAVIKRPMTTVLFRDPIHRKSLFYRIWKRVMLLLYLIEIIIIPLQCSWTEIFVTGARLGSDPKQYFPAGDPDGPISSPKKSNLKSLPVFVILAKLSVDALILVDCFVQARLMREDEHGNTAADYPNEEGETVSSRLNNHYFFGTPLFHSSFELKNLAPDEPKPTNEEILKLGGKSPRRSRNSSVKKNVERQDSKKAFLEVPTMDSGRRLPGVQVSPAERSPRPVDLNPAGQEAAENSTSNLNTTLGVKPEKLTSLLEKLQVQNLNHSDLQIVQVDDGKEKPTMALSSAPSTAKPTAKVAEKAAVPGKPETLATTEPVKASPPGEIKVAAGSERLAPVSKMIRRTWSSPSIFRMPKLQIGYGMVRLFLCFPWELFAFTVAPDYKIGFFNDDEQPQEISLSCQLFQYQAQAYGVNAYIFCRQKLWAIYAFLRLMLTMPYTDFYNWKIPQVSIPVSRLMKTFLLLIIISHIDACLFWFTEMTLPDRPRWVDIMQLTPYVSTITFNDTFVVEGGSLFINEEEISLVSSVNSDGTRAIPFQDLTGQESSFGKKSSVVNGSEPVDGYQDKFVVFPSFQTQYLKSYLSAVRCLELKPRKVLLGWEIVFSIFEWIVGVLVYGSIAGNVHSIVEMLDRNAFANEAAEHHQLKMTYFTNTLKLNNIPVDIQKKAIAFQELQWSKSPVDHDYLFRDLPSNLKQAIKNHFYLDLVAKMPIFQPLDMAFLTNMTSRIKPLYMNDGVYLFRKDDDGLEMYIIVSGQVEILIEENGEIKPIATLSAGKIFGEVALLSDTCKRTASARAKGMVELGYLQKEDFISTVLANEEMTNRFSTHVKEFRERDVQRVLSAARKHSVSTYSTDESAGSYAGTDSAHSDDHAWWLGSESVSFEEGMRYSASEGNMSKVGRKKRQSKLDPNRKKSGSGRNSVFHPEDCLGSIRVRSYDEEWMTGKGSGSDSKS
ncbi:Cyclic nucleotide-gated olfactory channel [Phlyctochytrium planicorne]|nr:Cyclic nucleotide-gated olfactory channel [Phlyctochytrium planicorne]